MKFYPKAMLLSSHKDTWGWLFRIYSQELDGISCTTRALTTQNLRTEKKEIHVFQIKHSA